MTRVLGAERVPAGFTITTEACVAYMTADREFPDGLDEQVAEALARLEEQAGKRLGDPDDPLLVSVRSRRARVDARDARHGPQPRPQRRVGRGPARDDRERALRLGLLPPLRADVRQRLPRHPRRALSRTRSRRSKDEAGRDARHRARRRRPAGAHRPSSSSSSATRPARTSRRTRASSCARRSGPSSTPGTATRAVEYRRINRIPDDWGTAVNVQQMVFGNKGDTSCSGVAFRRDEITGAPEPSGDFLPNAQGEDVVSGVRTPRDLSEMKELMPDAHAELMEILRTLERHYRDMQDMEFTVEEGRSTCSRRATPSGPRRRRCGSRSTRWTRGCSTSEEALATIDAGTLDALLHPTFDPRRRVRGARQGRGGLARRRQGRDRVHRRGRGRRPPRRAAT